MHTARCRGRRLPLYGARDKAIQSHQPVADHSAQQISAGSYQIRHRRKYRISLAETTALDEIRLEPGLKEIQRVDLALCASIGRSFSRKHQSRAGAAHRESEVRPKVGFSATIRKIKSFKADQSFGDPQVSITSFGQVSSAVLIESPTMCTPLAGKPIPES